MLLIFQFPQLMFRQHPKTSKSYVKTITSLCPKFRNFSEWKIPNLSTHGRIQRKKYLPRIDNLITLAKLYKVTLDEIIIIKEAESSDLSLLEKEPAYGISKEVLDFITSNANPNTKSALRKYYSLKI